MLCLPDRADDLRHRMTAVPIAANTWDRTFLLLISAQAFASVITRMLGCGPATPADCKAQSPCSYTSKYTVQ